MNRQQNIKATSGCRTMNNKKCPCS